MPALNVICSGEGDSMRFVKFILFLVMLWTLSVSVRAQTASSAIVLGRIVDASGAVVPEAQVTLRSEATNATRQQKTNNVGQYVFSAVPPGAYLLTVTKNGFETATLPQLQLDVNKSYTVDVPLTVGSQSQAVEVTTSSAVFELQTTDSTIGNVIGSQELQRLPTQSRDATELLNLQPGAMQGVSQNGGDTFSTTGGSVTGSRPDQNAMSLDGIDVTPTASFGAAFKPVFPLNVDVISEFRVGITNPNATFGNAGGAQESVTSKSGTNALHGVAYWYNQNSAFNASDWDSNLTGQVRPHVVDNREGIAVGGPIRKDKTFFFFNYEDRRFSQAIRTEKLVPSTDLRNGYLSFPDANGNLIRYNLQQYDPRGIGISPTIQKAWNLMPQGNDPGAGDGVNILGYLQNIAARRQDNDVSLKLDHEITSKLHFFGRYQFYRDLNPGALGQTNLLPAGAGGAAAFVGQQPTFGDGATAGLDWIILPTLISSFHFGEIRYREAQTPVLPTQIASIVNLPGTSSLDGPVALQVANFPDSNPYRLDQPIDNTGGGRKAVSTNYQIREDLNWTKGKHTFAFGGLYAWLPTYVKSDNRIQGPYDSIQAVIDGDQNNLFITGDRPGTLPSGFYPNWDRLYASALGMVDSTQVAVARDANLNPLPVGTPFTLNTVQRNYYFYAQDTWRFKPNLTLSYGLAYGWDQPPTESQGKMMLLVDSNDKLIDSKSYLENRESAALNGQIYNPIVYHEPYGKAGLAHAWKTDWTDVSPRMSLAWNPSSSSGFLGWLLGEKKTVIRGGYGISYDRNLYITEALTSTGFGQSLSGVLPLCNDPVARSGRGCNGASNDPALSAFRVGVDGPNIPVPPPDIKYPLPYGEGVNGIPADFWDFEMDPNYKNGRNHMFDLSIQREFAHGNIVEVGYIGRLGRRLPTDVSLTTPPYMFKDVTSVSGAKGSGQSFAQAYDAVATAVRTGAPVPTEPWFENQLPVGFGVSTCGAGFNNTECIAQQQAGNLISGNLLGLFGVAGQGGINGIRLAAGLPSFSNTQQADLLMHESYDSSNYNAFTATWRNGNWAGFTFDLNYTFSKSMDNGGRIQVFANGLDNAFNPHADYGPSYFDRTHTFNGTFAYEIPFGKGRVAAGNSIVNHVINGWYLGGIYTAATGVPLIATESFAYGGGFITTNPVGEIPTVSNISTGLHHTANGVNLFSNPNQVFSEFRPVLLSSDSTSGRDNPFRGFGNWNLDFRLGKQITITERVRGELSADFFNLFNHPSFNDPGAGAAQGGLDLTSGPNNFGTSTSSVIPGNRIGGARWVQLGLRISF
jgi:hypothetical protein